MIINEEEYLEHYGTKRHSGRYPWGSGGNEEGIEIPQRSMTFLDTVADLRRQGLNDAQIMEGMAIGTVDHNGTFHPSSGQFRIKRSIANAEVKRSQIAMAERLKAKGNSPKAIAERMGLPGESSVRALLAPGAKERNEALFSTSEMLKKEVDEKKYVDVGSGVEGHLGIAQTKLATAVGIAIEQGYTLHPLKEAQTVTGFDTTRKILAGPGVTQREVFLNQDKIQQIPTFSPDGGHRWGRVDHPPISVNPNRVGIVYHEDGGSKSDGMIFVRPDSKDLTLGNSRYSQVRILVGENHYLKGMAMYKDDLPAGTDLLFHTSKSKKDFPNKLDAMKPIGADKDYPFGSVVRQIVADPGTKKERNISAMNLVNEQGDWEKWKENLSSQILSKQDPSLAKSQLNMTYERRKKEFDEINALNNPTVKKKLLETFADTADAAAVHLKAAALPKSNWHAILPIDSIKPTEVYAPNYRDGERVVLIRYPHGGLFEIPELIVNNKNREAKKLLGDAQDAIGIHHTVAQRLSGADFDGDTVLVVPNKSGKIKNAPALEGLKNFEPRVVYKEYPGMVGIGKNKQIEMGKISNLITDMTLKGAPNSKIVRAIRHSMVIIDAENHKLDYKRSAIDNGIAALKEEYQGGKRAGAATIISLKKSKVSVPSRKLRLHKDGGPIDETGRKVFVETGKTRRVIGKDKEGNRVFTNERELKTQSINKLADTHDAHTLSSHTRMESLYADHSNRLKALANDARLKASKTPLLKYIASSKQTYAKEVADLNSKLSLVQMNRPRERQAQSIARASIKLKKQANPNLGKDSLKKITFEEQEKARIRTGARHKDVQITQEEWNAIQAGAISDHKLRQILDKADLDTVKKFATPRQVVLMTNAKTQRAQSMLSSGYSRADVAEALGVSLTTLDRAIKGEES